MVLLGLTKSSFGFFHAILQKNPKKLLANPNILGNDHILGWKQGEGRGDSRKTKEKPRGYHWAATKDTVGLLVRTKK